MHNKKDYSQGSLQKIVIYWNNRKPSGQKVRIRFITRMISLTWYRRFSPIKCHLLIKPNNRIVFRAKWLSCIKTKYNSNYEIENYDSQPLTCKNEIVSYCSDFLRYRHLYFPDYHSSGSVGCTVMRNSNSLVHIAISGILHP